MAGASRIRDLHVVGFKVEVETKVVPDMRCKRREEVCLDGLSPLVALQVDYASCFQHGGRDGWMAEADISTICCCEMATCCAVCGVGLLHGAPDLEGPKIRLEILGLVEREKILVREI